MSKTDKRSDGISDQQARRNQRPSHIVPTGEDDDMNFNLEDSLVENSDDEQPDEMRQELKKLMETNFAEQHDTILALASEGDMRIAGLRKILGKSQNDVHPKLLKFMEQTTNTLEVMSNTLAGIAQALTPSVQYMPLMLEKVEKNELRNIRRKRTSNDQDPFKQNYVIKVDNEERTLEEFSRQQVVQLIMEKQEAGFQFLNVDIKEDIRKHLGPYFSRLDEPRLLGWAVGQYVRGASYFGQNFIPQFKMKGDKSHIKDGSASGRKSVSIQERQLISKILIFCGGYLLVEYPNNDKGLKKNRKLAYLNKCRDGINSLGLQCKKEKNKFTNLMAHVENFVPLLEREGIAVTWEAYVNEMTMNATSRKEEMAKQKSKDASQFAATLQTTPLMPINKRFLTNSGNINNRKKFKGIQEKENGGASSSTNAIQQMAINSNDFDMTMNQAEEELGLNNFLDQ